MAIRIQPLEKITSALGYVCVFWVWLESSIDELIEVLAPLEKGDIHHVRDPYFTRRTCRPKANSKPPREIESAKGILGRMSLASNSVALAKMASR